MNDSGKKRKAIPPEVKYELRKEVGFGCPVKGCGNPYLEYHHFDPPVHVSPHNNPKGMIALCAQHHKKADGGAYTVKQLHELKEDKANAELVKGSLDWLRKDLLAVVGGTFYYETPRIIVIDGNEVVALNRDEDGYLRLSVNMLSILREERIVIKDSVWENIGNPMDLRCPPLGKELEISYHNGDYLYLRFFTLCNEKDACEKYDTDIFKNNNNLRFPITVVEVNLKIGGTNIELTPESTSILGLTLNGGFVSHCGGGIFFNGTGIKWAQNPKWELLSRIEYVEDDKIIKVNFKSKN